MIFYRLLDEALTRNAQHDEAYSLLARALKASYGIESFTLEKGAHGKPYLSEYPNIHFNISHCKGLAICGISEGNIGVDAELIRPYSGRAAGKIFSEQELDYVGKSSCPDEAFFRIWTLKEALGKNIGTGLTFDMAKYSFTFEDGQPLCKGYPEKIFTQKILQKKWVVSICADDTENIFEEY